MLRGTEMQLIERICAALRRGILEASQTHCVYIIEQKDFDIEQKDFDASTPQRCATGPVPDRK
jgi:hypothetical protein